MTLFSFSFINMDIDQILLHVILKINTHKIIILYGIKKYQIASMKKYVVEMSKIIC